MLSGTEFSCMTLARSLKRMIKCGEENEHQLDTL